MVKQLNQDMIELLHNIEDIALNNKAEQLIQDSRVISAYDKLDYYCDLILKKLPFIRRHKECPHDVNEAVSSLIFASARYGNLPELQVLRKLFRHRYGDKFVAAALELFPGNLVNQQLKEILMVDEKARDNWQEQSEFLAIEYFPQWQQQSQVGEECEEYQTVTCDTFTVPESTSLIDATSALVVSSFQQEEKEKVEDFTTENIYFADAGDSENKGEMVALVSCTEISNLPLYNVTMVNDPLDDIAAERYQISFSFEFDCGDDESDVDQDESTGDEKENKSSHTMSSSRKSRIRSPMNKRPRRRSVLFENQCLMDIGHMMYYGYPKHVSPEKENILNSKSSSLDMCQCQCSLNQPCYCFVYYDQERMELLTNRSPHKPNDGKSASYDGAFGELLLTYPGFHQHSGKPKTELEKLEISSQLVCYAFPSAVSDPRASAQVSRAATMPPERHDSCNENILRTHSLSPQQPKHVHPKLPEYEDIYAKFTALKREWLETKDRKQLV
ncbi:hypothetical protein PIB30_076817 [Stylosanthes scabra]|uniref:Uncharacterized protein n=1 Tax=Stylosanthes scabra TaxID=79078 RepID=A0ABU6YMZ8_9FABA|nr:hypothetical protein [Stylosanthes scabra]